MIVLGIETSTDVCSVALGEDGVTLGERSLIDKHIHSEKLLTLLDEVLDESRITIGSIQGIAVSIGPGSFTGLRIGLSSAKGLCYALGAPLAAVPTFAAIAHAVKDDLQAEKNILVALDAKKGDFYSATFSLTRDGVEQTGATTLVHEGNLGRFAGGKVQVAVTDKGDRIAKILGGSVVIEDLARSCRGSVVARLGWGKIRAGQTADLRSIEPTYLKDFMVKSKGKASAA